jgi:hypothetical protein
MLPRGSFLPEVAVTAPADVVGRFTALERLLLPLKSEKDMLCVSNNNGKSSAGSTAL